MTEQEQRIAIAEVCGWKQDFLHHGPLVWHKQGVFAKTEDELPDYLHNLNDIHDAEKVILEDPGRRLMHYIEELRRITSGASFNIEWLSSHYWEVTTASADQRSEAFLRTMGKWKD